MAAKTHGGQRAKARRLQVGVAEAFARACGLTILAEKPTLPGERNGVIWVPEGEPADLKVRVMGQAGADVALLTEKARTAVALDGRPLWVECKNAEALPMIRLDQKFWRQGRIPTFIKRAVRQAERGMQAVGGGAGVPTAILSKNHWPMIAVVGGSVESLELERPVVRCWGGDRILSLTILPFEALVWRLDGARIVQE